MAKRLKDNPRRWRMAFTPLQLQQPSVTGSFYYHCDWHASYCVNAHRKEKLEYNLTVSCHG